MAEHILYIDLLRVVAAAAEQWKVPASEITVSQGVVSHAASKHSARFGELAALGFPLAVGTSRKRFVGAVTGREGDDRDAGTAATSVILRLKGAVLFRVHNVAINVDALKMADAMLAHISTTKER